MAQSRLSYTQVLAAFDNIAKTYQTVQAYIDGGFTGESTNTFLYGVRYLLETRLRAWTSDDGIAMVTPPVRNLLRRLDSTRSNGTTDLLAPLFGPTLGAIMAHQANYDTTYSDFWAWFNATKSAATNDKVLGEVAELMNAYGLRVDPDHCVPPANLKIATCIFSGAETSTLTKVNDVDPLLYKGHTAEIYCVARAAVPDEIVLTIGNAKDETDGPNDDGATEFTVTIADTIAAGQTVDIAQTDSHELCSITGATSTSTGGKADDSFIIRVKQYRAASF